MYCQMGTKNKWRLGCGSACLDPSNGEAVEGGLEVQIQPLLHGEFKANLDYIRICFQKMEAADGSWAQVSQFSGMGPLRDFRSWT